MGGGGGGSEGYSENEMKEVFNLFSFVSVVQVKRSCYFTDYQFRRPTTSSGLYNAIS